MILPERVKVINCSLTCRNKPRGCWKKQDSCTGISGLTTVYSILSDFASLTTVRGKRTSVWPISVIPRMLATHNRRSAALKLMLSVAVWLIFGYSSVSVSWAVYIRSLSDCHFTELIFWLSAMMALRFTDITLLEQCPWRTIRCITETPHAPTYNCFWFSLRFYVHSLCTYLCVLNMGESKLMSLLYTVAIILRILFGLVVTGWFLDYVIYRITSGSLKRRMISIRVTIREYTKDGLLQSWFVFSSITYVVLGIFMRLATVLSSAVMWPTYVWSASRWSASSPGTLVS